MRIGEKKTPSRSLSFLCSNPTGHHLPLHPLSLIHSAARSALATPAYLRAFALALLCLAHTLVGPSLSSFRFLLEQYLLLLYEVCPDAQVR